MVPGRYQVQKVDPDPDDEGLPDHHAHLDQLADLHGQPQCHAHLDGDTHLEPQLHLDADGIREAFLLAILP